MSPKSRKLVSLPLSYSSINYPQKLLSGLGKPTKRGIKKCVRCGFYNGTRSTMCKNKLCGMFLRDSEEKANVDLDAVKLITGTSKQVYSVHVRDMGPDYRGFIQLPFLQSYSEEDSSVLTKVALCFVDSCQRSFDDSILKCHEEERIESSTLCPHINSALNSTVTATPIEFKYEVIHTLSLPDEFKETLTVLANEKEGPLVQRVSKSVMAVKCQVTPKHPLGYLHFTFVRAKGKEYYDRYYCSCMGSLASENKSKNNIKFKCIHYYACIGALAGDSKYAQEFSYLISNNIPVKNQDQETSIFQINKRNLESNNISSNNNRQINIISNQLIPKPTSHMKTQPTAKEFYKNLKQRIPELYQETQMGLSKVFNIMNILHLKHIFDTPKIKLKISKKFVHNDEKGYIEYYESEESNSNYQSTFIFFINVGQSTVDESDNTNNSFVIEWIPNLTSLAKIGQLKLQYKYGRKST